MDLDTRGLGCYCCLQMWSQFATACTASVLLWGCGGRPDEMSGGSPPLEPSSPDLVLHEVAFARLSEGRIAGRGTARGVVYRRGGGRLDARSAVVSLYPDPGTGYAMFGEVRLSAPAVEGDLVGRRGTASGGVFFRAARGDSGETERVAYDGPADQISGDRPVDARGPAYAVRSHGFSARADGSDIALTGGVSGTLEGDRR